MKNSKQEQAQLRSQGQKRCSICTEVKPLDEFVKDPYAKYGYASRCKKCHARKTKERGKKPETRPEYLERRRERARKYRAALPLLDTTHHVPGYLYVFQWDRFFKIGRAIDPHGRVGTINKSLPFEGKLIQTIKTNDMVNAEISLHNKFSDKRQGGEWFLLSESDLLYLRQIDFFECKQKRQSIQKVNSVPAAFVVNSD